MNKEHSIIQKMTSGFLLVVFLFAIAPHNFIHDVVAHHQDTVDHFHLDTEVSSHHTHCKFLQVVIAPFTSVDNHFKAEVPFTYMDYAESMPSFYTEDTFTAFYLRGPPLS